MAYSVVSDVRKALSPTADPADTDTPSGYSDVELNDSIARADAQIDTYLRRIYTVPVVSPDATLRDWSSAIACYLAVLVQANGQDIQKTDPAYLRYDRAMQDLKLVATGALVLPYPLETVDYGDDVTVINRYDGDLFNSNEFFPSAFPSRYANPNSNNRGTLPWNTNGDCY